MTDPYARPAEAQSGDATIPLVPEEGYAATAEIPFTEDTVVNPGGPASPWASDAPLDLAAPDDRPAAADAPTALSNYRQPDVGFAHTNDAQASYPQQPAASNYTQPQVNPGPAMPAGQQQRPVQAGYAEPSGFGTGAPPQNIYQGYPTAPQAPAWPAVIQDPVGYDYGYSRQPAASDHPHAVISLVLGIIGLTFFPLLAPVAWYFAAKGRREMAAQPGRWRPSGSLTAGLVLGIIGTVVLGFFAIATFLFIVMVASF